MDRMLRTPADALRDPRLTEEQLSILRHALGLDKYGQGQMYRNHFCAGGKDEDVCRELVAMGLMRVFAPNASPLPYYNCAVTEHGKAAVREQSPTPPKLTRAQKRYRRFLAADCGVSFGEWLKWERQVSEHEHVESPVERSLDDWVIQKEEVSHAD